MRRRVFGTQRPADREEGGDQHGYRHQHKEPAQRGVDLVAEHDSLHVFQRFGRRNDRALLNAGGEFLRLRRKPMLGFSWKIFCQPAVMEVTNSRAVGRMVTRA